MSTEDNLWNKGCIFVTQCSLCGTAAESTHHLFNSCSYAKALWIWFSDLIDMHIDLSSFDYVLKVCDKGWSSQCLDVVISGIINVLCYIWFARNQAFNNNKINVLSTKNLIISNVSLLGNNSVGNMANSVEDLMLFL